MRYMGGKANAGKEIARVLSQYRRVNQVYIEPFVGMANVIEYMNGARIGIDAFKPVISLFHKLQSGWKPFTELTKEQYEQYRYNTVWTDENLHLKAFVGIGCSYGGKLWGGYAQGDNRNFCDESARALLKKLPYIQDVLFLHMDYRQLRIKNALIYCDPPYKNTTQYKELADFNHDIFWQTVRNWSKQNTVIVSEYQAPNDFDCIWQKETSTTLTQNAHDDNDRIERLFKIKGS